MRTLIPHDSTDDFFLRWGGCFGTSAGVPISVDRVSDIDHTEQRIKAEISTYSEGMWERQPTRWYSVQELDLTPLPLRMINLGKYAVHLSQAVKRSYRLGMVPNRYALSVIGADLGHANNEPHTFPFSRAYVQLLSQKEYDNVETCIDLIMSKRVISRSFHKHFAIAPHLGATMLAIYRGRQRIGEISPSTCEVTLPYKHRYFIEELQELGLETILEDNM